MNSSPTRGRDEFFPSGALFFFAALTGFYTLVWLGLYAVMVCRGRP